MAAEKDVGEIIVEDRALRDFVQMPLVVVLDQQISAGAKVAYGLLLWYAWRGIGFPGQQAMGAHLGTTERSIRTYLRDLMDNDYLEVKQHGLGRPNTYIIKSLQNRPGLDRKISSGLAGRNLPVQAEEIFRSLEQMTSEVTTKTLQQQQNGFPLPDEPTAVVVVPELSNSNGLTARLEALGVWSDSIPAIIDAHDATRLEGWVAEIETRMRSGGEFRSGPAAFLVAALRNGWPLPERGATGNGRKAAELARLAEEQETAAAEEARRERHRMEDALGVDGATRELWEIVRNRLHEQGHGHWALASAYLGPIKRGTAMVTTPAEMLVRPLEERGEAIRGALQEATGKPVKAVEVQVAQT